MTCLDAGATPVPRWRKLSRNFEVPESDGDIFRDHIRRWIQASSQRREESRPAPSQLVQLCNQSTGPSNLAEIVALPAVNFIASKVTDLPSIAAKESIGLPVSKSFASARPEPVDIG